MHRKIAGPTTSFQGETAGGAAGLRARVLLLLFVLGAYAVRVVALEAKGLSYDEAATALMARAPAWEIVTFHWNAAFEHPPVWQLLMYAWSIVAGQSEFALRYIPAAAGVAGVPLIWVLGRRVWPAMPAAALIGAVLTVLSPTLLLYSQEARMYTLVVAFALAAVWQLLKLTAALNDQKRAGAVPWRSVLLLAALLWAMTGLQYYSLLAAGTMGLYVLVSGGWRNWRAKGVLLATLAVGMAPALLWLVLSPGVRATLDAVRQLSTGLAATGEWISPRLLPFLDETWRDLSFGSVRWQPPVSVWGYLLLPSMVLGLLLGAWLKPRMGGMLVALLAFLPIALSGLLFGDVATRYMLYVLPLGLLAVGVLIVWLWAWSGLGPVAVRGMALMGVVLVVATVAVPWALALPHYWRTYEKSEYRSIARSLNRQAGADDLLLLEGPRQHLLWRYYGRSDLAWEPVPLIELPDHTPVNAPPVIPEETDDQLQRVLHDHGVVWLLLTGENEVDRGEFVPRYLRAVAYRQQCEQVLDARLCRFVSPAQVPLGAAVPAGVRFGASLVLADVTPGVLQTHNGGAFLPVQLRWVTDSVPEADWKVSLRLVAADGAVLAQEDDLPIGPLLPPVTWPPGEEKLGYFVLNLPAGMGALARPWSLELVVYDSATGVEAPAVATDGTVLAQPVRLMTHQGP